jgi:tRNA pseudouridine55 synthase
LKRYVFTVRWGQKTNTGDNTGEVLETSSVRPTATAVQSVLSRFRGAIMQTPPAFSALKVVGKRAYVLARAGQDVPLKPRKQHIKALKLQAAMPDEAAFEVVCDSGTYVRALGEDIAVALGTCGHLTALRRTAIGPWKVESAYPLDLFEKNRHDAGAGSSLLRDPRTLLDDIPAVWVSQEEARRLTCGQAIAQEGKAEGLAFCVWQGRSVALVEYEEGQGSPRVVFENKEL